MIPAARSVLTRSSSLVARIAPSRASCDQFLPEATPALAFVVFGDADALFLTVFAMTPIPSHRPDRKDIIRLAHANLNMRSLEDAAALPKPILPPADRRDENGPCALHVEARASQALVHVVEDRAVEVLVVVGVARHVLPNGLQGLLEFSM